MMKFEQVRCYKQLATVIATGKGGSVTYPNEFSTYYVMHLNDEPSSQNNAPINFSGSISLSQN